MVRARTKGKTAPPKTDLDLVAQLSKDKNWQGLADFASTTTSLGAGQKAVDALRYNDRLQEAASVATRRSDQLAEYVVRQFVTARNWAILAFIIVQPTTDKEIRRLAYAPFTKATFEDAASKAIMRSEWDNAKALGQYADYKVAERICEAAAKACRFDVLSYLWWVRKEDLAEHNIARLFKQAKETDVQTAFDKDDWLTVKDIAYYGEASAAKRAVELIAQSTKLYDKTVKDEKTGAVTTIKTWDGHSPPWRKWAVLSYVRESHELKDVRKHAEAQFIHATISDVDELAKAEKFATVGSIAIFGKEEVALHAVEAMVGRADSGLLGAVACTGAVTVAKRTIDLIEKTVDNKLLAFIATETGNAEVAQYAIAAMVRGRDWHALTFLATNPGMTQTVAEILAREKKWVSLTMLVHVAHFFAHQMYTPFGPMLMPPSPQAPQTTQQILDQFKKATEEDVAALLKAGMWDSMEFPMVMAHIAAHGTPAVAKMIIDAAILEKERTLLDYVAHRGGVEAATQAFDAVVKTGDWESVLEIGKKTKHPSLGKRAVDAAMAADKRDIVRRIGRANEVLEVQTYAIDKLVAVRDVEMLTKLVKLAKEDDKNPILQYAEQKLAELQGKPAPQPAPLPPPQA